MPTISVFLGIAIRMYYDEHGAPHFHVHYGEYDASLAIDTLEILEGRLPRRILALVLEWAVAHRPELRENWRLAEEHAPLGQIEPLE